MAPQLVLVPGLACDGAVWADQVAALEDLAEVRVADVASDDSLTGMAERILAGASGRFAIAGLSLGGRVALEAARMAPERVTALGLLATSAGADPPSKSKGREEAIGLVEAGRFDEAVSAVVERFVSPRRLADPDMRERIRAMATRVGPEAFVRQQRALLGKRDITPHLAAIPCDTLVLCGREDDVTPPSESKALAQAIPNARLTLLDGCGHMVTLDQPQATAEAMRGWLDGG